MDKPNTKCRVCGKEYYCCADSRIIGAWKTMTCSPECFKEYMARIEKSRTHNILESEDKTDIPVKQKRSKIKDPDKNDED